MINSPNSYMNVIKKNGLKEPVSFDKILKRVETMCSILNLNRINPFEVTKETISGLYDGITTEDIDHYAATHCSEKIRDDCQYDKLAASLCVSRLHKMTSPDFMITTQLLFDNELVTDEYYLFVKDHIVEVQSVLDYTKDYDFDYFGFKTLEKSYLHKVVNDGHIKIIERPQHLLMRVATYLNMKSSISELQETYRCLSNRYFIFGSPTLYNSASKFPQLSSCFLLKMGDSLESILDIVKECGLISKRAGGIGIGISNVRASGSKIIGTNGQSTGVVPMIQVLNWLGRYVNQGGKRNGAIAVYLEPWHADVFAFCELRSNKGNEDDRARDIFLGLWIPDLFMKRVQEQGVWSLMCPNECPGLTDSYGLEFEEKYIKYEKEGNFKKQVPAKELWFHILSQQIETGMPYMLFKDNINRQTNHKNLGVIQSSNLCVSYDTYVLTNEGQVMIGQMVNKQVTVWNGFEWSDVCIKQTGEGIQLMKVTLSNGAEICCTKEHKFYLKGSIKNCENLMIGDELINYRLPKYKGKMINSDMTFDENVVLLDKGVNDILNWFKILYEKNGSCQIRSQNKEYLLKIRLALQICGIDSYVTCDGEYKLSMNIENLNVLMSLCPNIKIKDKGEIGYVSTSTVSKIEYLDGLHDTFCFTESKRGLGMFNGVLTGQCGEIAEFTSGEETAVCNLASICLPRFVEDGKFNYEKLRKISEIVTYNLNNVIDANFYPVEKAKFSNLKHRPVGIGIQGLADVYCLMDLPYDSDEARIINRKISETIYYGALCASNKLAIRDGPYETFWYNGGCPFSKGQLQWHLWGLEEKDLLMAKSDVRPDGHDWPMLIDSIVKYGTRNSLLTTIMPTASTSQIMGNSESYEAPSSAVYIRKTMAGEFTVVNKILVEKLIGLGLWTKDVQNELLYDNGSIQNIACIPDSVKKVFKTAFEIQNKPILTQAIERGPFIDQTQSMNLFMKVPSYEGLTQRTFLWMDKTAQDWTLLFKDTKRD